MTPAEFFTLPAFTQAVDKLVEFKDGAFYVERCYNLSYEEKKFGGKDNQSELNRQHGDLTCHRHFLLQSLL